MPQSLENLIGNILEESAFLKSLESLKDDTRTSRLFGERVRLLSATEIEQLEKQGNVSGDWAAVLVTGDFTPANIRHSSFYGACRIGRLDGIDRASGLPAGISRTTVIGCEIGHGCVIRDTAVLRNCVVMDGAVVSGSGSVTADGLCTFGNGIAICVGNETGGREVLSYADMTVDVADAVARSRSDGKLLNAYKRFIGRYVEKCASPAGYIGRNAVIMNTATVEDSYIGDHVSVIGATLVKNSSLLGSADEKTGISHGAYVKDSCVQWGCEVTSMAIVDRSVMCEHSHAERHGKVTMSIVGPNSGVAEGEATSCLLGPFVGFHHQSMLIAALWPEGRGNVGYGANIGSNHTSKSPDQEIWCGEGMFFGLGTSVKYPANFIAAPYSIIATGLVTLPQKVEFPFSLINGPSANVPGMPPAYNEIFPGWVLANNIYAVRRNEGKLRMRNKARRSQLEFTVLRPAIVDLMIAAKNALARVGAVKEYYSDSDIAGLGRNFMTEQGRKGGIAAYEMYIEYYALMRMFERLSALKAKKITGPAEKIYEAKTDDGEWEHARAVILSEGYGRRSVKENLLRLAGILAAISESTLRSKKRDDERGMKIIPDYAAVNTRAEDDRFVGETMKETIDLNARITEMIKSV